MRLSRSWSTLVILDSGPDVDLGSVGVNGSAATWLRGGTPQSAPTRGRYCVQAWEDASESAPRSA